jgi:hypothetical protein
VLFSRVGETIENNAVLLLVDPCLYRVDMGECHCCKSSERAIFSTEGERASSGPGGKTMGPLRPNLDRQAMSRSMARARFREVQYAFTTSRCVVPANEDFLRVSLGHCCTSVLLLLEDPHGASDDNERRICSATSTQSHVPRGVGPCLPRGISKVGNKLTR